MIVINSFLEKHRKRVVGLDIIRTVAILIVVYEHGRLIIPDIYKDTYLQLQFIKLDGVSIFFVLSGFLIGSILLKVVNETDFKWADIVNFWIRRWFRTLPNYFFVLLGIVSYIYLMGRSFQDFNLKYFLFAQNLAWPHPSFFGEAWSLSVEEWFYLLFPFLIFILLVKTNNKKLSFLIGVGIFLLVPLVLRFFKYDDLMGMQAFDLEIRKVVIYRLDSIMYGVLASYVYIYFPDKWNKARLFLFILGVVMLASLYFNWFSIKNIYKPLYFNLESIITFCFLPFLSRLKSTGVKLLDFSFIYISIISYSMYLIHRTPVLFIVLPLANFYLMKANLSHLSSPAFFYILYWSVTLSVSTLIYYFFESPMTNLRDKFVMKKKAKVGFKQNLIVK